MNWKYGAIATVVIGGAFAWYLLRPSPPDSLLEAVRNHPEVFPAGYRIVMPLTAASRLGQGVRQPPAELPAADYTVTDDLPCFFISPKTSASLDELRVSYSDSRSLNVDAEANHVSASAGLALSKDSTAEMVLSGLRAEHGIGWPNLNGCRFDSARKEYSVVTGQLIAQTVTFTTSTASTGEGNAAAGGAATPSGEVSTGWKSSENGRSTGADIVISAVVSPVQVETIEEVHEFGTTPQPSSTFPFPNGFDGSITLDEFDASTMRVKYRVTVPVNATKAPTEGLNVCETATPLERRVGERCDFWLPPGNVLVSATWVIEGTGAGRQLVLRTRAYRTTFPPTMGR